jgi:hypothetical protein
MIELQPAQDDDAGFLSLAQRIINGAVAALEIRDVFLVHVDNWFDFKWLYWGSQKGQELRVPPFTPNRVRSEKRFAWDADRSAWASIDLPEPLHVWNPGEYTHRLARYSRNAAFIWYSGNTVTNKVGSLMLYLSGADDHAWYTSLRNDAHWFVADEYQITRRELSSFEDRGRELELAEGVEAANSVSMY